MGLDATPGLWTAHCARCKQYAVWIEKEQQLIYPESSSAPLPHADMPANLKRDYNEARSIHTKSPRGAAALLRLSIQKLCIELGEKGRNIDADIANLVKKGLPVEIQQALDYVRVIGNNAVHPGQIDLSDDPESVGRLFVLVNFIVDRMISHPQKVANLFSSLPESAKQAIAKRDGPA